MENGWNAVIAIKKFIERQEMSETQEAKNFSAHEDVIVHGKIVIHVQGTSHQTGLMEEVFIAVWWSERRKENVKDAKYLIKEF